MQIITRQEAKAQGLKSYFTGEPCLHGHIAERSCTSKHCLCRECRDERNERTRLWRAAHPDRQAAAGKAWSLRNPEAQKELWRRSERKKQERDALDSTYRQHRRNLGRKRSMASFHNNYNVDNAFTERVKANAAHQKAKRRLAKNKLAPTQYEINQIKAIYRLRYALTRNTGVEYHVDHCIPLSRGGEHHPSNLWVITAAENLRKGNRLDWVPAEA